MAQGFTTQPFFSLGRIAQIVNFQTGAVATGTTLIPADDTTPQITEGDQYMTCTITPQNANNTLIIEAVIAISSTVANWMTAVLFKDAVADALAVITMYQDTANGGVFLTFKHTMIANTVNAITFRVRVGGNNVGMTTFNGVNSARLFNGVMASSITITEYMPQAIASQIGQSQRARAYRANAQNVGGGNTKILIDTDSYDPDNITDLVNSRIIPTKAGYYVVIGESSRASHGEFLAQLYKNDVVCAIGGFNCLSKYGDVVTDIIYFNGSTDYVELWIYSGAVVALDLGSTRNYLSVLGPF